MSSNFLDGGKVGIKVVDGLRCKHSNEGLVMVMIGDGEEGDGEYCARQACEGQFDAMLAALEGLPGTESSTSSDVLLETAMLQQHSNS